MTQEVEQILDALASRFGTTAEMLWETMLTQVYISAFGRFIAFAVFLFIAYRLMKTIVQSVRHEEDHKAWINRGAGVDMKPPQEPKLYCDSDGQIIVFLILLFTMGLASLSLYTGMARIINPVYYAIQLIMEML